MKKALVFIFALILSLALCGCAGRAKEPSGKDDGYGEEITVVYITVNGNKLELTPEQNCATDELLNVLERGDVTYTADDYGGFEKVGDLGFSLPRKDVQTDTQAGDVVLYQGDKIVIFYGSNSWAYTRIGKIEGYSVSELKDILGAERGSVQVTLSLK